MLIPPDERIGHLTRLAARGFNRSMQLRLAGTGVTFGLWVFLRLLWRHDGATQRELADLAQLTEPTTHTAILKLEELGYVTRATKGANRRRQHVHLTASGWALREQLEPLALEVNRVALAGLDGEEARLLRQALLHIIANLAADEESAGEEGRTVPPTRVMP